MVTSNLHQIAIRLALNLTTTSADPEVGQGVRSSPGKSQVIRVSIGNKQLDLLPLRKVGPPLENVGTPSGTLKNDRFL